MREGVRVREGGREGGIEGGGVERKGGSGPPGACIHVRVHVHCTMCV